MEGSNKKSDPIINPNQNPTQNLDENLDSSSNSNVDLNNLQTHFQWTNKKTKEVIKGTENLVGIDEKLAYKPNKESFMDDAARQNAWVREFIKFDKIDKINKKEKTDEEIENEIEIIIGDSIVKGAGYEVDRGIGIRRNSGSIKKNGEVVCGIDNNEYKYIRDNATDIHGKKIFRKLEAGVSSAFKFARYFIKESEKEKKLETDIIQNGDRLFMSDTLDAVSQIDFIGINKYKDGYLGTINLIQIKSSRPSPEDIKSIQDAHKDYIKNTKEISIAKLAILQDLKQTQESNKFKDILNEKYGGKISDLMFLLLGVENKKNGVEIINNFIHDKKNKISFNDEELAFLASFLAEYPIGFRNAVDIMGLGLVTDLELNMFIEWINSKKINIEKTSTNINPFQEYSPNNVVSGRKFSSVIFYKGIYGWVNIVEPLTY